MAEIVFTGSSEVPTAANHTCSNEDGHDSSSVRDTDNPLTGNTVCFNKTVTDATICNKMPEDDPTDSVAPVDIAVLQTDSSAAAAAEASDADKDAQMATDNAVGISNGSRHSDVEQPSVNGDGTAQQSDGGTQLDASGTAADDGYDGLKRAVNRAKQKFIAFQQLDHPASVVIDLRSPPLVQVCLLHGADDVGAGGSGSSGSTGVPRRPQTARRGRRSGMTSRKTNAVGSYDERVYLGGDSGEKDTYMPSNQTVADSDEKSRSKGESAATELSTLSLIHI